MRSYDAKKLSADSLEVSFQDPNILLNFRDDFRFLWAIASTDLTSKMAILAPFVLEQENHIDKTNRCHIGRKEQV